MSGPLLVVQLLETPLLCLVGYARWARGLAALGWGFLLPSGGLSSSARLLTLNPDSSPSHSLIATNAARLRLIAGPEKRLLEMGLRRAQGPDGGLTASTYSYLGGEDQRGRQGWGRRRHTQRVPHCLKSPNPA